MHFRVAVKRNVYDQAALAFDEERSGIIRRYVVAAKAHVEDVRQVYRSVPKRSDVHFLVQVGRIVDQDVEMTLFTLNALEKVTDLFIVRKVDRDRYSFATELVDFFGHFMNIAGNKSAVRRFLSFARF